MSFIHAKDTLWQHKFEPAVLCDLLQVLIPLKKIRSANQSENVNEPAKKYIEVVTDDNFDFWFMGFLRYEKAFTNLQKAISMANRMQ